MADPADIPDSFEEFCTLKKPYFLIRFVHSPEKNFMKNLSRSSNRWNYACAPSLPLRGRQSTGVSPLDPQKISGFPYIVLNRVLCLVGGIHLHRMYGGFISHDSKIRVYPVKKGTAGYFPDTVPWIFS
jgi:hypothetical protein